MSPIRRLMPILVVCLGVQGCAPTATSGPVVMRSGQTVFLQNAYWVQTPGPCTSLLKSVTGVDVIAGDKYLALSLKPQIVRTWQCGNEVAGAVVLATAKRVPREITVHLRYIVHFATENGPTTSEGARDVDIVPR